MASLVRVKNLGKTVLRLGHNSEVTVIAPGSEGFVDRECAARYFGNWTLRNTKEEAFRLDELNRLKGLAGCNEHGVSALIDEGVWEDRKPQVELHDLEGKKIITVLDDPTGETLPLVDESPNLQRQIEVLQEQLDTMRELMESGPETPVIVEEDAPGVTKRKPGRPAKVEAFSEIG